MEFGGKVKSQFVGVMGVRIPVNAGTRSMDIANPFIRVNFLESRCTVCKFIHKFVFNGYVV